MSQEVKLVEGEGLEHVGCGRLHNFSRWNTGFMVCDNCCKEIFIPLHLERHIP